MLAETLCTALVGGKVATGWRQAIMHDKTLIQRQCYTVAASLGKCSRTAEVWKNLSNDSEHVKKQATTLNKRRLCRAGLLATRPLVLWQLPITRNLIAT